MAVSAEKRITQADHGFQARNRPCKLAPMERRQFLIGTAAVMSTALFAEPGTATALETGIPDRTYSILGVPLRSGSLYPGNENEAGNGCASA